MEWNSSSRASILLMLLLVSCGAVVTGMAGESAAADDTDAPHLVAFDFEPKAVNTALSSQVITFTAHLTDDLSGIVDESPMFGPTQLRFRSPSEGQFADVTFRPSYHLVSGDVRDGIYISALALPRYCETGVWHLQYFHLYDGVGNRRTLYQDDMVAAGFPAELTVLDDVSNSFLPAVSRGREN